VYKIIIFNGDIEAVQTNINIFLENYGDGIKVINMTQTEHMDVNVTVITVSILYQEKSMWIDWSE